MNEITKNFLLVRGKFIPKMRLRHAFGFTYSACGSFNKDKERIQKF